MLEMSLDTKEIARFTSTRVRCEFSHCNAAIQKYNSSSTNEKNNNQSIIWFQRCWHSSDDSVFTERNKWAQTERIYTHWFRTLHYSQMIRILAWNIRATASKHVFYLCRRRIENKNIIVCSGSTKKNYSTSRLVRISDQIEPNILSSKRSPMIKAFVHARGQPHTFAKIVSKIHIVLACS